MRKLKVLIEIDRAQPEAFTFHATALRSREESTRRAEKLAENLAGLDLDVETDFAPVPLFPRTAVLGDRRHLGFTEFATPMTNPDVEAESLVIAAEVDPSRLSALREKPGVKKVSPNSTLTLLPYGGELFSQADGTVDCRPFRPAVSAGTIRSVLGVRKVWALGHRGEGIVVGIIDEGIDGTVYPVIGGFSRPGAQLPGTAPITSHGSMCAADVLVAAPGSQLYDYPFLGVPNSGGALTMFQAVLDQRRLNGTPHLTSNSYGFVGVPPRETDPFHEIHDLDHPLHRKIREVIVAGAPAFFAAGNCGTQCPSGRCQPSGIGPGRSIHASNSLAEVITIAAVNHRRERIGYSSQGPGMFEPQKPDLAAYSHFFGNFGPGRPGGAQSQPFDNGTSAATPVAAGVAALLLSAFPSISPAFLKRALIASAIPIGMPGWNAETGNGVINAAAAYNFLRAELGAGVGLFAGAGWR